MEAKRLFDLGAHLPMWEDVRIRAEMGRRLTPPNSDFLSI